MKVSDWIYSQSWWSGSWTKHTVFIPFFIIPPCEAFHFLWQLEEQWISCTPCNFSSNLFCIPPPGNQDKMCCGSHARPPNPDTFWHNLHVPYSRQYIHFDCYSHYNWLCCSPRYCRYPCIHHNMLHNRPCLSTDNSSTCCSQDNMPQGPGWLGQAFMFISFEAFCLCLALLLPPKLMNFICCSIA